LFEAVLDDLKPTQPAIYIRFRAGDETDLRKFNRRDHGYDEAALCFGLERLAAGDRLIIGEAPSGFAFYGWLMFGQMDLGCRAYRPVQSDCVYTYKLFTAPSYRGLRICPAYYGWLKNALQFQEGIDAGFPRGVRRIVSWVESKHAASIRSHEHAGLHRAGIIWHIQFLFRSYFFKTGATLDSQAEIGASSIKCGS
jgi:hypothetical protein